MTDQQRGRWALIVHGGAKEMPPDEEKDSREGIVEALEAGQRILEAGGSAVDAVEASVRVLETLPVFNAGHGAALTADGHIEMSAGIMDGKSLQIGAIAFVSTLKHPISVAKALLAEKWVVLVGEGALRFAEQKGAEFCTMDSLITEKNRKALKEARDTVGAVALDRHGNIAVAAGTGGLTGAPMGRVSDTTMPGCGYYADNRIGAVALSGDGETIARTASAGQIMARINDAGPDEAIRKALEQLPELDPEDGDGGAIAIDREGRVGWWHNSPNFIVATASSEDPSPKQWIRKDEEQSG